MIRSWRCGVRIGKPGMNRRIDGVGSHADDVEHWTSRLQVQSGKCKVKKYVWK